MFFAGSQARLEGLFKLNYYRFVIYYGPNRNISFPNDSHLSIQRRMDFNMVVSLREIKDERNK